jgi:hypothetical protein
LIDTSILLGKPTSQVVSFSIVKNIIRHFGWQKSFIQPTTIQLWTIITLKSAQTKATAAVSATACFDAMFVFN